MHWLLTKTFLSLYVMTERLTQLKLYLVLVTLDQIADIEYIQKKMLAALRIPKPFLGFDEPSGEGKNLALQDIRFARTINRVQQSMVQELNKIAIVHLYILGFEDELENFYTKITKPINSSRNVKSRTIPIQSCLI